MPELPEVEILRRELEAQVVGRTVSQVQVTTRRPSAFSEADVQAVLAGRALTAVRRRGKLLVLDFDGGQSLVVHLMMVGQFLLAPLPEWAGEPRDVVLILDFTDGAALTLGQVDLRYVHLLPTEQVDAWPAIAGLGVDPTEPHFTVETLARILHGRRGALKSLLMNQKVIAGLGNTYVDEILFRARLSPTRPAGSLSPAEVHRLHAAIVEELARGFALGGSSEMAFVHLDGTPGRYQEEFRVNQRKGQPCPACGTLIAHTKVGGRGTYWCPQCQQ
jgi:formamidopyrimidine-DNA glycosylase